MGIKKLIKIFLLIFFVLLLIFVFNVFSSLSQINLSADQEKTISLFGHPDQFSISYLPSGDENKPTLSRFETWYYSSQGKKISFLAGEAFSSENYTAEQNISATTLRPEDFSFDFNYDDIVEIVGKNNLIPIDVVPGFESDDAVQIYGSKNGLFVVENNSLTYMQTFSLADSQEKEEITLEDEMSNTQDDQQENDNLTSSWNTFFNNDLNISLKYPPQWFLTDNDVVLTDYDTNYLVRGDPAPEDPLKCDFIPLRETDIQISDKKIFSQAKVTVSKGQAKSPTDQEGPGLGDSVIFLIEDGKHDPVALLCYMYKQSAEQNLKTMFETVEFIE